MYRLNYISEIKSLSLPRIFPKYYHSINSKSHITHLNNDNFNITFHYKIGSNNYNGSFYGQLSLNKKWNIKKTLELTSKSKANTIQYINEGRFPK